MDIDVVTPAHNAEQGLPGCLSSIATQSLPEGHRCNVIVVDDGSEDDTAATAQALAIPNLRVIRHAERRGRAAARNAGARAGSAPIVVFVDSDLTLARPHALRMHLASLRDGASMSIGGIVASGSGFWARYQRRARARRARHFATGGFEIASTAFCAIWRRHFENLGGFDEGFIGYGFEDRDFVARLQDSGLYAAPLPDCIATHEAALDARALARKMLSAGQFSGQRFRQKHPDRYANLDYARVDLSNYPYALRRVVAQFAKPLLNSSGGLEWLVNSRHIPIAMKLFSVRLYTAFAYAIGSARASIL